MFRGHEEPETVCGWTFTHTSDPNVMLATKGTAVRKCSYGFYDRLRSLLGSPTISSAGMSNGGGQTRE